MAKVTWNESNTIGSIDFSARKFADKKGSPKACARVAGFVADMSAADVKYMNDQVDFVLHRSKENATYQKERTDRKPLTPEKLADLINTQKLRIQEHGFTAEEANALEAAGALGSGEAYELVGNVMRNIEDAKNTLRAKIPATE